MKLKRNMQGQGNEILTISVLTVFSCTLWLLFFGLGIVKAANGQRMRQKKYRMKDK